MALALSGSGWWLYHARRGAWSVRTTLILGAAARLIALTLPASDDVNRYLWEGKLVRQGLNPYASVAADPQLAPYRDAWWPGINHKEARTVYAPLAQYVFAAAGAVWYHPMALKLLFGTLDLLLLTLLVRLATSPESRRLPLPLYALNPVPVMSFAGGGHVDVLMLLAMVAAYSAARCAHPWTMWFWMGLGAMTKVTAGFMVPLLLQLRLRPVHTIAAGFGVSVLVCLPFSGDLANLLFGLIAFGGGTSGNACVHFVIELATGSKSFASVVCGVLFVCCVAWFSARSGALAERLFGVYTAFLLLSPTVTFWYVTWLLPWAILSGRAAFAAGASTSAVLYYAAYWHADATGRWEHPLWAHLLFWIPTLAAGAWELRNGAVASRRDVA